MKTYPGVTFLYLPLSLYRDTAELGGLRAALRGFPLVFSNPDVEIYQLREQLNRNSAFPKTNFRLFPLQVIYCSVYCILISI